MFDMLFVGVLRRVQVTNTVTVFLETNNSSIIGAPAGQDDYNMGDGH
jgi:hypothetical protein